MSSSFNRILDPPIEYKLKKKWKKSIELESTSRLNAENGMALRGVNAKPHGEWKIKTEILQGIMAVWSERIAPNLIADQSWISIVGFSDEKGDGFSHFRSSGQSLMAIMVRMSKKKWLQFMKMMARHEPAQTHTHARASRHEHHSFGFTYEIRYARFNVPLIFFLCILRMIMMIITITIHIILIILS